MPAHRQVFTDDILALLPATRKQLEEATGLSQAAIWRIVDELRHCNGQRSAVCDAATLHAAKRDLPHCERAGVVYVPAKPSPVADPRQQSLLE